MAKVVNRIRSECASAKDRWEKNVGKGQRDSEDYRRFQPLRVVMDDEVLALNLASSEGHDVDLLQKRIEHIAYSGYEGYSFASVMSIVPEPYLPAIATLEAVRRGADLGDSDGTPAEVSRRLREGGSQRSPNVHWVLRGPVSFCRTANRVHSGFQIVFSKTGKTGVPRSHRAK